MTGLGGLPRLSLGRWPTPVRLLEHVSKECDVDVYAKVEEECGAWGGNKVRKLEYILAAVQADGVSSLIALGAGASSWAAACALHGIQQGFRVVLALAGPIPRVYEDLYRALIAGVHRVPLFGMLPAALAAARASTPRNTRILPLGGTGSRGDVGSTHAGIEVGKSVAAGDMPRFTRVFVATGTGGTTAGMLFGLALQELSHMPVVAARVTPRPLGTAGLVRRRVRVLERTLIQETVNRRLQYSPIACDDRFYPPGYGRPGPQTREAIEIAARDGITVDAT